MNANNELARIYEALLCVPGMNDNVKIDLKITRKNVLLLTQLIDRGLSGKSGESGTGMAEAVAKESLDEIKVVIHEFLEKAGLVDLDKKLRSLPK